MMELWFWIQIKPNGTPAIELFETGEDFILEIGLTPNRGDATSHLGAARDLKAFFKKDSLYHSRKISKQGTGQTNKSNC